MFAQQGGALPRQPLFELMLRPEKVENHKLENVGAWQARDVRDCLRRVRLREDLALQDGLLAKLGRGARHVHHHRVRPAQRKRQ